MKHLRQNVMPFVRITDKGDVAVAVDHERLRNLDRKTRLHPKRVHCACVAEPDRKVQLLELGQPRVQMGPSIPGGRSAFVCPDGDDLNSTVLVSLLQLYQIEHRLTFTRGSPKFKDVEFARLEARKGLTTYPVPHFECRRQTVHLQDRSTRWKCFV